MSRSRTILWGVLLVLAGVFLLLRNTGAISADVRLWPLLLLALGVWLLLDRLVFGTRLSGGLVWPFVLIALGVVLVLEDLDVVVNEDVLIPALVITVGAGLVLSALFQRRGADLEETVTIPLGDAEEASVRLDHAAGRLRLRSMVGGPELIAGHLAGGATTDVRREGSSVRASLRARSSVWSARGGRGLEWDLSLNRRVPVSLELNTGASEVDLELTDLLVRELAISAGASRIVAQLPTSGRYSVRLKGGAMRASIHVPIHVAARIVASSAVSSVKVDERRFLRSDGEWRSPDYDSSEHRAEIRIDAGAASIEVD